MGRTAGGACMLYFISEWASALQHYLLEEFRTNSKKKKRVHIHCLYLTCDPHGAARLSINSF